MLGMLHPEYSRLCLAEQQKTLWALKKPRHLDSDFRNPASKGLMRVPGSILKNPAGVWPLRGARKRLETVFKEVQPVCGRDRDCGVCGEELGDSRGRGVTFHYTSFCTVGTFDLKKE